MKIETNNKKIKNSSKENGSFTTPRNLDEHGVIYFSGEVDGSTIAPVIKFILEANLDASCEWDHIDLIINSEGGLCTDGFALIDIMFGSRIPIYTIGIGQISSMALSIFLAGEKGHRVLTPNCMILSHQFYTGYAGKEHELLSDRNRIDILSKNIMRHYQRTTGLTEKEISEYLLPPHDVWLTATEAKKLGICDVIKDLKPRHLIKDTKKTSNKSKKKTTKATKKKK